MGRGRASSNGQWLPPEDLRVETVEEGQRALPAIKAALQPVGSDVVAKWLASLGVLCAGQMSAADAKIKMAAYVPLIEEPAIAFTSATLKAAGERFKWFPSFSEITEFLREHGAELRLVKLRLERIALEKPAEPRGKGWSELTPEQKAEHERMMARVRQSLTSPAVDGAAKTSMEGLNPAYVRDGRKPVQYERHCSSMELEDELLGAADVA